MSRGDVTPGEPGSRHRGEVISDMTTGFVALCAIYFPSVTGLEGYTCVENTLDVFCLKIQTLCRCWTSSKVDLFGLCFKETDWLSITYKRKIDFYTKISFEEARYLGWPCRPSGSAFCFGFAVSVSRLTKQECSNIGRFPFCGLLYRLVICRSHPPLFDGAEWQAALADQTFQPRLPLEQKARISLTQPAD